MTEDSPRGARLDHVSDAGDLVFEAGGERFVVTVDDALERAVLAAKQIRMESRKLRQPRANDALPISKIQQLIRAGADPSQVAERYGLDQALVRRFSASVQMEKQYAIEQFKRVPAPKESRVRTVEDLIYMTLSLARVDRGTLAWQATRRGHEPWHISATFLASGRKVRAEWTWDMHDNTVVCLNPAAKKLLGEQNLGLGDVDGRRPDLTPIIAENMTSAAGMSDDVDVPTAVDTGTGAAESTDAASNIDDAADTGSADPNGPHSGHGTVQAPQPATMGDIPVISIKAPSAAPAADGAVGDLPPVPDPTEADLSQVPAASGTDADSSAGSDENGQPARKHRARRSAIPSWDQILFGE
ncbi:hypothetical protein BW13_04215 [Bifidobacterium sp. UTCIF-37]|uniref:septation protein SepH n=1 Tax=unclassified Bifidobacterium TaxID=2608897 RepID=UPI0011280A1E|nr:MULTISPECIES: septation protein SepH [unclassified Bifidobacterium]TPF86714.1 hypothetical protein BW13_04215 [Bifidobacterium sp. UTCIF-37]TPF89857.1 hypothetical protein BW11_04215 [Bifidobacterium sp. UTCIF-38]